MFAIVNSTIYGVLCAIDFLFFNSLFVLFAFFLSCTYSLLAFLVYLMNSYKVLSRVFAFLWFRVLYSCEEHYVFKETFDFEMQEGLIKNSEDLWGKRQECFHLNQKSICVKHVRRVVRSFFQTIWTYSPWFLLENMSRGSALYLRMTNLMQTITRELERFWLEINTRLDNESRRDSH